MKDLRVKQSTNNNWDRSSLSEDLAMQKAMAGALITFLLFSMVPIVPKVASSSVIKVPQDYPTIQAAINAADDGDTVEVAPGTYHECIVVNKSVTLIGYNTIIDAYKKVGGAPVGIAFEVEYVINVVVRGFIIQNAQLGVKLWYSERCIIHDNTIDNSCVDPINLKYSSCNVIANNYITSHCGILLFLSHRNVIDNNIIWGTCHEAIFVMYSDNNVISNNVIGTNIVGVFIGYSAKGNVVRENTISNNDYGLMIGEAYDPPDVYNNTIYRNNFLNNLLQVFVHTNGTNFWDNGAEGNYWSDYNGRDLDGDGVGDTSLPWHGVDYHPLTSPWSLVRTFPIVIDGIVHLVNITCNSTVASFNFSEQLKEMSFNVTGPSGTRGFCNVTIPKQVINGTFVVLVGKAPTSYALTQNATHSSIYFTYVHSTQNVKIVATIPADLNGDRLIDIFDVIVWANAFGSVPEDPYWYSLADLVSDGVIDIFDGIIIAVNYGKMINNT